MNALLFKAIAAIRNLPEAEQEAIAREILERIEADARWDALFADPRSEALLDRLADEALDEVRRGEVVAQGGVVAAFRRCGRARLRGHRQS